MATELGLRTHLHFYALVLFRNKMYTYFLGVEAFRSLKGFSSDTFSTDLKAAILKVKEKALSAPVVVKIQNPLITCKM